MKETFCPTQGVPSSVAGGSPLSRQQSSLSPIATGPPSASAAPVNRRIVVVLGMHRSGTSLLANLLTVLGLDLGGKLLGANSHNEAGHWEQEEIYRTQDALLRRLGRDWSGPAWTVPFPFEWDRMSELRPFQEQLTAIVREEISQARGIWGFKDPRTSRLLPLWKEIFNELHLDPLYLLAIRQPAAVVESVLKRDKLPASHTELLWLLHNLDAVRDTGDQLRLVVDYDGWFAHPRQQARAIAKALDIIWPDAGDERLAAVQERIRPDLRHCRATRPPSLPFVTETYEVLRHAATAGQVPGELRHIDEEVRRALSLCEPWARAVKELVCAQSTRAAVTARPMPDSTPPQSVLPAPDPAGAVPSPAESVAGLVSQGRRQYEQGELEGACRSFTRATEIANHDAAAHAQLGCVLARLNRLEEARIAARRARDLNPELLGALRLLASLAAHQGRNDEGAEYYARIVRLAPNDLDAQLGQARCSLKLGHRVLARIFFEQVLASDPTNAEAAAALAPLPKSQAGACSSSAGTVTVPADTGQRSHGDILSRGTTLDQTIIDSIMKTMTATPLKTESPGSDTAQIAAKLFNDTGPGPEAGCPGRQTGAGTTAAGAEVRTSANGDTRFARFRFQSPMKPRQNYQQIKQLKIDLIAGFGRAASIRDFGGLWGVYGLYLLEGAKALQCRFAEMVDVTPRPEFDVKIAELHRVMPLEVKMTQGDFRDSRLFHSMGPIEVALLYEVLLHQDNAVEVIKNVAGKTTRCICVAQPVMKEELFALPNGAVNLQFYPEELKDQLRYSGWWEKEPATDHFTPAFWMWGQTTSHLTSIFHGYGWEPTHLETYEAAEFWNYAMIRFEPRARK